MQPWRLSVSDIADVNQDGIYAVWRGSFCECSGGSSEVSRGLLRESVGLELTKLFIKRLQAHQRRARILNSHPKVAGRPARRDFAARTTHGPTSAQEIKSAENRGADLQDFVYDCL